MSRKGRRPVAAVILAAVPLALLSVPVSILTAAVVFTSGFQKMASQGAGGVAPVSELCLGVARQLLVGAAPGSMDASQFSAYLATLTTWALGGALATALLLAAGGPCVALLVRPIERHRGMRGYAWAYLIMVGLLTVWRLSAVLSLETWVKGAQS